VEGEATALAGIVLQAQVQGRQSRMCERHWLRTQSAGTYTNCSTGWLCLLADAGKL
jgi:hypothetical protein